jgi:MIP family channel proteins
VSPDPFRRAVAELVGAFALVFCAAGALMNTGGEPVAVALASGLAVGVMASAVGHISGGHFNPAVTLGFVVTRRMAPRLAGLYWLAQLGGGALAALLLRWVYPKNAVNGLKLGAPQLNAQVGSGAGFVVELVLTFFLVWVVFASAADERGTFKSIAGLAIGFTVSMGTLLGSPLTGGAMNPARAFGPFLVQNTWHHDWIWLGGPLVGGALAALAYEWLYLGGRRPAPVGTSGSGLDEPRAGEAA